MYLKFYTKNFAKGRKIATFVMSNNNQYEAL